MFDLEATGLRSSAPRSTRITELAMVAVGREELARCSQTLRTMNPGANLEFVVPRVVNKMVLPFYPGKMVKLTTRT